VLTLLALPALYWLTACRAERRAGATRTAAP
jgi:hypothetical protein